MGAFRVQIKLEEFRLFDPGRHVLLSLNNIQLETKIEQFRQQHGRWILKLEGIDSISAAEKWIGALIMVAQEELPTIKPGTFYSFDLEGCRVYTNDKFVGTVKRVITYPKTELLSLENENEEILIPFVKSFINKIDIPSKRIDVELPEGLIDLNRKKM